MRAGSTSSRAASQRPAARMSRYSEAPSRPVSGASRKASAVAGAAAVVDRQHVIAVRGEMLVHDIGVGIIAGRVEAGQHLPARAAVDEDQRRARPGPAAAEQLAVDLDAVGGAEDDRLRRDEARRDRRPSAERGRSASPSRIGWAGRGHAGRDRRQRRCRQASGKNCDSLAAAQRAPARRPASGRRQMRRRSISSALAA